MTDIHSRQLTKRAARILETARGRVAANVGRHGNSLAEVLEFLETGKIRRPMESSRYTLPTFERPYLIGIHFSGGPLYAAIDEIDVDQAYSPLGLGTLEFSIRARVGARSLVPALLAKGQTGADPGRAEVDFTFTSTRSAEENLSELSRFVAAQEESARRSEEYFASRYPVDRGEFLADADPEDLGDIEAYQRQLAGPPPALVPLDQAKQEMAA